MSEDDGSDLAAIAWPGFVDILSSVVIMFVFFTMIVAVALYFHTIIYKSQIVQEAKKSTSEAFSQQVEKLSTEKKGLEDKVASLNEKINQLYANLSQSVDQKTLTNDDDLVMYVFFSDKAITVTQDTKDEVEEFVRRHLKKEGEGRVKFTLQAGKDPDAPTESMSRTVAFSRLFNTRNVFVNQEDIANGTSVSVSLVPAEKVDDNYHWVKISVVKE